MALDHPDAVSRIAVIDIAPTATMYARTNKEFATRYFWWFFLIQPAPLPERMIGADPEMFLPSTSMARSRQPERPSLQRSRNICAATTIRRHATPFAKTIEQRQLLTSIMMRRTRMHG